MIIKSRVLNNASWLIGCQIVQSLLSFVIGMMTARYLGPSNYGIINYASSVVAFVLPVVKLGFDSMLVNEMINRPDEEGKVLGTTIGISAVTSILAIVGVNAFAFVANPTEPTTKIVVALYSITIFINVLEMIRYWFQTKLLSRYSSVVSIGAYIIVSAYKIFLLITQKPIYWFVFSHIFDGIIIIIASFIIYKKLGGQKLSFSLNLGKEIFKKSKYYIVSNMMITIFANTDRIMLKQMVNEEEVGFYSVGMVCVSLTSFVFSAIIDSMRPSIFESKKINNEEFEKKVILLYSAVFYLAVLQAIAFTVFSKLIVGILYGPAFMSAADVLQILVWYAPFSYIGGVRNIWILAEGKQKYLWSINLAGAVFNILLNFLLIPYMGAKGAAVASLCTQAFANVVLNFFIKPIRRTNLLILKSLNPKFAISVIRERLR